MYDIYYWLIIAHAGIKALQHGRNYVAIVRSMQFSTLMKKEMANLNAELNEEENEDEEN